MAWVRGATAEHGDSCEELDAVSETTSVTINRQTCIRDAYRNAQELCGKSGIRPPSWWGVRHGLRLRKREHYRSAVRVH